jgi:predicted transcriptional regulator
MDCLTLLTNSIFVKIVKVLLVQVEQLANPKKYRDRIYIVKDIILTLAEYGQLNQTALFSFCGLNITKHKSILDNLEQNEIIQRIETVEGKRTITIFKVTHKGMNFCHDIIEPYEKLFPRDGRSSNSTLNL